jgi:hypothetical protein
MFLSLQQHNKKQDILIKNLPTANQPVRIILLEIILVHPHSKEHHRNIKNLRVLTVCITIPQNEPTLRQGIPRFILNPNRIQTIAIPDHRSIIPTEVILHQEIVLILNPQGQTGIVIQPRQDPIQDLILPRRGQVVITGPILHQVGRQVAGPIQHLPDQVVVDHRVLLPAVEADRQVRVEGSNPNFNLS